MALPPEKLDAVKDSTKPALFLDGPGEFLVKTICQLLLATPQWKKLFGGFIDPYKRMDYEFRNFPVCRVYSESLSKPDENWFVTGPVTLDLIWPADMRRPDLQQIPDRVAAAMLQQFRRTTFFDAVNEMVPGLNELGRTFDVQKGLAYAWESADDEELPLTQIVVNFRLDLREWDRYLETESRTVDDPFTKTLESLDTIAVTIQAMRDDNKTVELSTTLQVDTTGSP